eukprot:scaffold158622_cov31-Tisochrysis_lutea.AAC.1
MSASASVSSVRMALANLAPSVVGSPNWRTRKRVSTRWTTQMGCDRSSGSSPSAAATTARSTTPGCQRNVPSGGTTRTTVNRYPRDIASWRWRRRAPPAASSMTVPLYATTHATVELVQIAVVRACSSPPGWVMPRSPV